MKLIRNFALLILLFSLLTQCSKNNNSDPLTGTVGSLTDIEGNTYKTIQIGTQTWMSENLKVTQYSDGESLINGDSLGYIYGDYPGKYYFNYPESEVYDLDFGLLYEYLQTNAKLYTWPAASRLNETSLVKGICPDGWHLPSLHDWTTLFKYVGIDSAARILRAKDDLFWSCKNNPVSTDQFGFNVIPTGGRDAMGAFYVLDLYAFYWSSTKIDEENSWASLFTCSEENLMDKRGKLNAFPVRCVKD